MARASEQGGKRSLGTWMWNAVDIMKAEEVLDFLTSHDVTEVYLSCAAGMPKSYYRKFISACYDEGIRVAVIGAEADWAIPNGQKRFDSFLKWVEEYQNGCEQESEKFYAIHMDVEPHQLPEWQTDREMVQAGFVDFLVKARGFCDRVGMGLEADIPFWFDSLYATLDGERVSLGQATVLLSDATLIMSYRDNAEAALACGNILHPYAVAQNKKFLYALETGKIYEEINITFHHLGTDALNRELNKLYVLAEEKYPGANVGYAVHYYHSWKNLPPDGHPRGEDYPYND